MTEEQKDQSVDGIVTTKEYFLSPVAKKLLSEYLFSRVFLVVSLLGAIGFFGGKAFIDGKIDEISESKSQELTTLIESRVSEEVNKINQQLQAMRDVTLEAMRVDIDSSRTKALELEGKAVEADYLLGVIQNKIDESNRSIDQSKKVVQQLAQNAGDVATALKTDTDFKNSVVALYSKSFEPEWIEPQPLNKWVRYSEGYSAFGYMKDSSGVVHLKGLVKNGDVTKPIFVLPEGFRPAERQIYSVFSHSNPARLDVSAGGEIIGGTGAAAPWISLSGITFKAEK